LSAPYTPELQPAERLRAFPKTPLINARLAGLNALYEVRLARCQALQTKPALVAATQSATHYHWPAADYPATI
jgi:hypothetical protein